MALNKDNRIMAVANSMLLRAIGQIATVIAAPIVLTGLFWMGSTLISVDQRLGRIETTVNLKMPDIYPRGEAVAQFSQVESRIDGLAGDVEDLKHRTGALEDARNRYQPAK